MKASKPEKKICSRGHEYTGSGPCPVCWPGYYREKQLDILTFQKKLERIVGQNDSLVSVGLDPYFDKLPERFRQEQFPQFAFNRWIMDETHEFVSVFKPQLAHYEARGSQGWRELEMTVTYARKKYSNHVLIADAKRGDIGSTNEEYAVGLLDHLGFDAITLHPYLGKEALEPFLSREDKGLIILCRTSNPGAGELQDLSVDGRPVWEHVAQKVSQEWNERGNCMLVVGATYPEELRRVREIVDEMSLLVPGIGAQGGDLEAVMKVGLNSSKQGLLISASRSIIFAADPAIEAKKLRDQINAWR